MKSDNEDIKANQRMQAVMINQGLSAPNININNNNINTNVNVNENNNNFSRTDLLFLVGCGALFFCLIYSYQE